MTFSLRPFQAPADYTAFIDVINLLNSEPYTPDDWQAEEEAGPPGLYRFRMVALSPDGQPAGLAECARFPWDKPGDYHLLALVVPTYRQRGLGAQLLALLEGHARSIGATTLSGSIRDNESESVAWVERRGYQQYRHTFESTLDLANFDPAPFASVIPAVEGSGIRFTTLAEELGEPMRRAVSDLMGKTMMEIPGQEGSEPDYQAWQNWYVKHKDARLDGIILALDGDRIAGVTALRPEGQSGTWYTHYTGVYGEYRGRQIALALKLKSIALAMREGAPQMRTNNDSKNGPMLAVNRKLGYKPEPGYLRYRKAAPPNAN